MLDYSLVAAVAAVVREGSFERAATVLHVTPSAVSQRVKLLEQRLGQLLVVRGQPCTATTAGHALCRHAEQVAMLEAELAANGAPAALEPDAPVTLRVAVNADSLATWFVAAAAAFASDGRALLDVRLEDQDHTAQQLRDGEVIAAVTALAAPVHGCSSLALGRMGYLATASPGFVQHHFGGTGVDVQTLALAPCLTFNQKDRLQEQWQQAQFGQVVAGRRHWLPASQAFVDAALAGLGWGMNPASLVRGHVDAGRLVELVPGQPLWVSLYWQHARSAAPMLARLTSAVLAAARTTLDTGPAAGP